MSRKAEFFRLLEEASREPWGAVWLDSVLKAFYFVADCWAVGDEQTVDEYLDLLRSDPEAAEQFRVDVTVGRLLDDTV